MVRRRVKYAGGESVFCELPDGTIGSLPAWMMDLSCCSDLSLGSPLVSVDALVELRALLDSLHLPSHCDNASVNHRLQEGTNGKEGS